MKQNCSDCNLTLTLVTALKPKVLSKRFSLGEDGSLTKISGGQLIEGTAKRLNPSLEQFLELLAWAKPKHAFCYGTFAGPDEAIVVTQEKLHERRQRERGPVIARDRNHFSWPEGPGILFGDYDAPPDGPVLTRDELLAIIYSVWPELQEHPHVWWTSASSCIYRTDTGEELRSISGQRIYIPIQVGRDTPRLGAVLTQRFWLAGHGRYEVSKSGAFLERGPLDATMFQPERFDFSGGAQCGPGIEQRRPVPMAFNVDKPFIDSRTLKDLTRDELELLDSLKADARKTKKPEVEQKRDEWITERLAELKPDDAARARRILESAVKEKRLLGDFVLHSAKHGKVTVGTILDNPSKYHNDRCADPLEPDYRNDKRCAWINLRAAGRAYAWSWAHGGQRYSLHRAVETVRIQGGELPQIVKRVLELMRFDGAVFDRGGELVRLIAGRTYPVTADWLQLYLTGLVRFEKFYKSSKEWMQIDCPKDLAHTILSMPGLWDFPPLEGVITAPTITPDGRIIDTDGHDEKTGLYLDLGDVSAWSGVPEDPSDNVVREAVKCLWRPFSEFPFESSVDRAGYFAALLTVVVRPLLPTAPGFMIPSPAAGSGKTLLARCAARLIGCAGEVLPNVTDDDEMRKRLVSLARVCNPIIIFDNISGTFESDSLSAFLTSEQITDRVLGLSSMVSGRTNSMVVMTGNNPVIVGDLNRRLLRARINPGVEKPYLRTFSLDPVEYVRNERLDMVRAALTILKASILSGFRHNKGRLASFEVWSDFIRNAVIWVGQRGWLDVTDPVESIEQNYNIDPETQRLDALLAIWEEEFKAAGGTVSEAIRQAKKNEKNDMGNPELFSLLETIAGEKGYLNPRRLGRWIERHEARIIAGRRFVRNGTRQRAVVWVSEFRELYELKNTTLEKTQSEFLRDQVKNTHQTHETHSCETCVNFSSNGGNQHDASGVCERTHGGRCPKLPSDGTDCPAFERVTH